MLREALKVGFWGGFWSQRDEGLDEALSGMSIAFSQCLLSKLCTTSKEIIGFLLTGCYCFFRTGQSISFTPWDCHLTVSKWDKFKDNQRNYLGLMRSQRPRINHKRLKLLRIILVSVWHLMPLIPIFFDLWAVAAAMVLLVGLCYIKSKKLDAQIKSLNAELSDLLKNELSRLQKTRRFWSYLTFLNQK